jgi:hypothetical protein
VHGVGGSGHCDVGRSRGGGVVDRRGGMVHGSGGLINRLRSDVNGGGGGGGAW